MRAVFAIVRAKFAPALQLAAALVVFLLAPIGFTELLLFTGVALIGIGIGMIYLPAGLIAAGAILSGVAMFGVR